MNTIDSNKSKSLVRGTMSNPYTEEEYQQLQAEGKDVACYVEGRGFCAPAAMAPPPNPGSPSDSSDSNSSFETSQPSSHELKLIDIPRTEVTDGNFKYLKCGQIKCELFDFSSPNTQDTGAILIKASYWGKIEDTTNTIGDKMYVTQGDEHFENINTVNDLFSRDHTLNVKYITFESNSPTPAVENHTFKLKVEWSVGYDSETSCTTFKKIKISLDPA